MLCVHGWMRDIIYQVDSEFCDLPERQVKPTFAKYGANSVYPWLHIDRVESVPSGMQAEL